MGFGMILCGAAFLFLPTVGIYDIMPDLIGYILITAGLTKTAQCNGDLYAARRNFRLLLFISAAKLLLVYPLITLKDETAVMLYVFSFSIAETVFLLPAFSQLCEGSYYVFSRAGCAVPDKAHDDLRFMSKVFAIGRAVLVTLPELTVLTNRAYDESVSAEDLSAPTLYDSKSLITVACAVVSLLIGTVFFILAVRYFAYLIKDKTAVAAVRERYETEVLADEARRVGGSLRSAVALFTAACVFMMTLYFSGVDVLPDFIGMLLAAFGFICLRRVVRTKKAIVFSFAAAAVCAASTGLEIYTANVYPGGALFEGGMTLYLITAAVKAAGFVAFAVVLYFIYACFYIMIRKYAKAPSFDEAEYKSRLGRRDAALCVTGMIACALSAAAGFMFGFSSVFRFAGAAIFCAYSVYLYIALSRLSAEISRSV